MSNLEGYRRKELKQVKKGQNWKKSMKQANSGQTSLLDENDFAADDLAQVYNKIV